VGASAGDGSAFADGANTDDGAQTCALFGGAGVDGAAGATGGERGAGARSSAAGQSVDFLRAAPAGGFGVTKARHEERAAKTPWKRTSGKNGGGTRIAKRAMNSIGVITRCVLPRRGVFIE
jgi:hypothetical protein